MGTSQKQHKLRSSVSVAKYCARKLSKHCSVVAVNNGKIAFQKEASSKYTIGAKGDYILLYYFPTAGEFIYKVAWNSILSLAF